MADDNKAISMYLEKKGLRTRTHSADEEVRPLKSRGKKLKGKYINTNNKFCWYSVKSCFTFTWF